MSKLMTPTKHTHDALLADLMTYISGYLTFTNPDYPLVLALWAIATFLWPHFDAFPYLTITSHTKRSGKTRLSEILSFLASNAVSMAGATAASVFRSIRDLHPTLFIDEAETLSGGGQSMLGVVLNTGYRRGQMFRRASSKADEGFEDWPTYCPKVFVLIGDVKDTLRDRSIIIRMTRGEPGRRFLFEPARLEGDALRERIADTLEDKGGERATVLDCYERHTGLPFLSDRDEELWTPLFVVCEALFPSQVTELQRIAVDIATEKTAEAERYINLQGEEKAVEDDEYARRLVRDLLTVIDGKPGIYTVEAIDRLKAEPTMPWRKFRGEGLTPMNMADMLSRFGVAPRLIKRGGKRKGLPVEVKRGYRREDVLRAAKAL